MTAFYRVLRTNRAGLLIVLALGLFVAALLYVSQWLMNDRLEQHRAGAAGPTASTSASTAPPTAPSTEMATATVFDKLAAGKPIHYLIVGDSIGQGDGAPADQAWYRLLNEKLQEGYGSVAFAHRLTVGGGTVLGGWVDYMDNRKLNPEFDLVFISFGQNDQHAMSADRFGALYESLVRAIRRDHPAAAIVPMIAGSLESETFPAVIRDLSDYYRLTPFDAREAFAASGREYAELADDLVHPNAQGYGLYAEHLYAAIRRMASDGTDGTGGSVDWPERPLYPESAAMDELTVSQDWDSLDGFAMTGGNAVADAPGSSADIAFEGELLGLSVNYDPRGGRLELYVDGEYVDTIDTYYVSPFNRELLAADSLAPGKHRLTIRNAREANPESSGTRIGIAGIISR